MTDQEKSEHWDSLLEQLGATSSNRPVTPAPRPATEAIPRERVTVGPTRTYSHPKSDWGQLASSLGIEVPPPRPAPVRPVPVVEPATGPAELAVVGAGAAEEVPPQVVPTRDERRPPKERSGESRRHPRRDRHEAPGQPAREPESEGGEDQRTHRRRRRRRGRKPSERVADDTPARREAFAEDDAAVDDWQDDIADADLDTDLEPQGRTSREAEGPADLFAPAGDAAEDELSFDDPSDLTSRERNDRDRDGEDARRSSTGETADEPQRRRRRRRGGRRRRRPEGAESESSRPSAADAFDDDEFDRDEAPGEELDAADEFETAKRGGTSKRFGSAKGIDVDDGALEESHADSDEGEESDDNGELRTSHKAIPSWDEAVGIVVSANMEARARNPNAHSGAPRRGRGGRGRGGRPGSR